MKSKQLLSIEQMQHLQELGMDTSNASMCYYKQEGWEANYFVTSTDDVKEKGGLIYYYDSFSNEEYFLNEVIPSYTLQDVLDALPRFVAYQYRSYDLIINMEQMTMEYFREADLHTLVQVGFKGTSLIEAAYEMLCWCFKEGYVAKNG